MFAMRTIGALVALLIASASHANGAIIIDFETGAVDGASIGNTYSALGASLPNAIWDTGFSGRPGSSGSFGISHDTLGGMPTPLDPIVIEFAFAVDSVMIDAIDVGFNDARMDAFDALVGGSLVDFDSYVGATALGNEGDANDTSKLSVMGASIRRVELYQPEFVQSNDGVGFDDLIFSRASSAVPEPSTLVLWSLGAVALVGLGYRRRQRAAWQPVEKSA